MQGRLAPALGVAAVGLLCLGAVSPASAEPPPEKERDWTFAITPYVWLPAMTGQTSVGGRIAEIDTSISDLFTETDFVFALTAQMESWYKRRFGFIFNGQWTVLKQDDNTFGPSSCPPIPAVPCPFPISFDLKMNMGLFEFLAAYDPGRWEQASWPLAPSFYAQPLVGARVTVLGVRVHNDVIPDPDATVSWADPILGGRVGVKFGPEQRWSWRVRGDVGGFGAGSDLTWNVVGLLGYDFRVRKAMSTLGIGARALYQDYKQGSGLGRFAWDVTQYGPLLFWSFAF